MSCFENINFGVDPITCHAWNKDRTQLAFSPNNHEVHIYKKESGKWKFSVKIEEHTERVTGIDWAPNSNRIVTCGADRNAYVWVNEDGGNSWKPTLVLLRINRAATCVRWSPNEDKFAVGSGARIISICYFEQENSWWVSKHIKKPIHSTVTCIDWHPNNILVAAGSTDFKIRVFSAYVKEIEAKPEATTWGKKMPFAALMLELSVRGWVHGIRFSPLGNKISWLGHDSSISVIDGTSGTPSDPVTIQTSQLPFMSLIWVNEQNIVVAGHDCYPICYKHTDGNIQFVGKIDNPSAESSNDDDSMSAMERFRSLDKRSTTQKTNALSTQHQNVISELTYFSGRSGQVDQFSSCGRDGNIVIWNLSNLENAMKNLIIR